jgi:hypothetical protein
MMQRAFGVPNPVGDEGGPTGVLNRACRTIMAELGVMGAAVNLMSSGAGDEAVVGSSTR